MSNIEKQFEEAVRIARKKIDKHLQKAMDELKEAEKISEEMGIPFFSQLSPIAQSFTPESFADKWADKLGFDRIDWASEIIGANIEDEYPGWQHSDVC